GGCCYFNNQIVLLCNLCHNRIFNSLILCYFFAPGLSSASAFAFASALVSLAGSAGITPAASIPPKFQPLTPLFPRLCLSPRLLPLPLHRRRLFPRWLWLFLPLPFRSPRLSLSCTRWGRAIR